MSRRCGYVALLGRPNVGKSTLLNRLVGQKISITAAKRQTTRHSIVGIHTVGDAQILYLDTPGLHQGGKRALNRYLNRAAAGVLSYADLVVFVIHALRWTEEDEAVLERLRAFRGPVLAAVNKTDLVRPRELLLPFLAELSEKHEFAEILPVSATRGHNLDRLTAQVGERLPEGEFIYPEEQVTNVSQRFLAAELVREKLTRLTHNELPYSLTVEVEEFTELPGRIDIRALIWVERDSQKGIVIGRDGSLLREVGRQARLALEQALGKPVSLKTWVKVRSGWADDERALRSLGYGED